MSYDIVRMFFFDGRYQIQWDVDYNKIIWGGYLHLGYWSVHPLDTSGFICNHE